MAKLTELTPEQEALMPVIRDKWINIGLSCEPVKREKVPPIIDRLYAVVDKPPPRFTIFLDNPLHVAVTITKLRMLGDSSSKDPVTPCDPEDAARYKAAKLEHVCADVVHQISAQLWKYLTPGFAETVNEGGVADALATMLAYGEGKQDAVELVPPPLFSIPADSRASMENILEAAVLNSLANGAVTRTPVAYDNVHKCVSKYAEQAMDYYLDLKDIKPGVMKGKPPARYKGKLLEGPVDPQDVRDLVKRVVGDLETAGSNYIGKAFEPMLREENNDKFFEHIREFVGWRFWRGFGQFDVWLSYYDMLGHCGVDVSKLQPSMEMAQECGWSLLFWDWAFISDKPRSILRDDQSRLHSLDKPAVDYKGFQVYAVHGVRVPAHVIMNPETITVQEIDSTENAEVRRVMIDRYGVERYIKDSHAEEIHRDDFGILYRKEVPNDEPIVMVKVVDATPEMHDVEIDVVDADGKPVIGEGGRPVKRVERKLMNKDYWLRVDPSCTTAHAAVAWTFGKTTKTYNPEVET